MTYAITYFAEAAYDTAGIQLFENQVIPALQVGLPAGNIRQVSTANPAFDLYQLSEDHRDIREAVRAIAEDKIAPHAAEVDEQGGVPAGGVRRAARRATSTRRTSPRSTTGSAPTRSRRASSSRRSRGSARRPR